MLAAVDTHDGAAGRRPAPVRVPPGPRALDLLDAGIGAVVWATGYRRSLDWPHVPVLDDAGDVVQAPRRHERP